MITTDFSSTDTIPVFEVAWKETGDQDIIQDDTRKINEWLKLRIKNEKVQINNRKP